jgi:hypothetical protein
LSAVAEKLSERLPDLAPLELPTFNREPDYLITLQVDAVAEWLEHLDAELGSTVPPPGEVEAPQEKPVATVATVTTASKKKA